MAWDVIFYATAEGSVPGADFLDDCPAKVRGTILAVLDAVAAAPPPAFSGGGKWEAMHSDMGGYYEIRVTGPGREQFRLFCLLENAFSEHSLDNLVVINPDPMVAGTARQLTHFSGAVMTCDDLRALYGLPQSWFDFPAATESPS
jgi:hypothetical protein